MLPLRPLRAALLAFIGALVLVEVGSGLVAGEAWRQQSSGALSASRREDLQQMLDNLRLLEGLVVIAILVTTVAWALLALYNATVIAHGSLQSATLAAVTLGGGPLLFLVIRAAEPESGSARLVNVLVQAFALSLPFWGLGRVADGVGGQKLPFFRWYLALGASFLLHELFTAQLDLLDPANTDEFGRTTMMLFINGLVVAVMGLMAADATRSMDRSIVERAVQRRLLRDDASMRTRASVTTGEQGAMLPPPTPPGTPLTAAPGGHGGVAVLDAPPRLAATPTLAPPSTAPVIAGPAEGAMPLPTLAAVQVPSLEHDLRLDALPEMQPEMLPEVVTPAVAIPVIVAEPVEDHVPVEPVVESDPLVVEPVAVEPVVAAPAPAMPLPPPVPSPLPPPPPGARSSMPKLLTITEMRPIPVIEPEPEPEPDVQEPVAEAEPVGSIASMFQPLTPRKL